MSKKAAVITILAVAAVAGLVFTLRGCPGPEAWLTSRLDSATKQPPSPPPPSDSVPNAPAPDNTIITAPTPAAPQAPPAPLPSTNPPIPNNRGTP